MALLRMVLLLAVLLICFPHVSIAEGDVENVNQQIVKGANRRMMDKVIDCGAKCAVRCSKNSRPNLCMRACGTCCARCKCVPSGTYGNLEECGDCYAKMTTHGGRRKCP